MRASATALIVAADVALGALIQHTLATMPPDPPTSAAPALPAPAMPRSAASGPDTNGHPDAVAAILARPLFSSTRRPPDESGPPPEAPTPMAPTALPRMTAILVDGARRAVIFAGPGGKPLVLSEGGHVGPFTVERIEPQQVTVTGPEGRRVVHTSFDLNPPPLMPVLPPGMPAIPGMPAPGLPAFPGVAR